MQQPRTSPGLPPHLLRFTAPAGDWLRWGRVASVAQWEKGLLFRRGRLEQVVDPGPVRRWRRGFTLRTVDMRPHVVILPTQEIPTADAVTVKVTIAGHARVTDPATYVTASQHPEQSLYLAVQVALRELVATTTVDDLLANRTDIGTRLAAGVGDLNPLGLAVDALEMRDLVLPGNLRKAQTEVLVDRAQGLAALERARGETAALRALANAARIAADNPALVQLRLLEQLEATAGHTVVIGVPPLGIAPTLRAPTPAREGAPEEPSPE